ncbi:hypothetical protein ACQEVZ_38685 [Dactylosporangium sp. CA-152071]|uniref:hypothetical protein n=1 Tax=Dactylosporangium sp. CA-152071 TaxID=3239933 RepID=UPI003D8FF17F
MAGRRHTRERQATPAEQAAYERAAELLRAAVTAPAGERQAAVWRARQVVDRIRDPGNLSNVPGRELHAVLCDRYPALVGDDQDHDAGGSSRYGRAEIIGGRSPSASDGLRDRDVDQDDDHEPR